MSVTAPPRVEARTSRAIAGSERPFPAGAALLGPVVPAEIVTVTIRLRRRLDRATQAAIAPRTVLSHAEFADQFGASDADVAAVLKFATASGLAVDEVDANRRIVSVSGPARAIGAAFGVELVRYRHAGRTHRGFAGALTLPLSVADLVEHVVGLDNRPLARPMLHAAVKPADTITLTPAQIAGLYDFPTGSAAGQTIGIIELGGGFRPGDVQGYFETIAHAPAPSVTFVSVDGAPNAGPGHVAAGNSALHSYYGSDTSQHIHTIGLDGHVHELYAEPGSTWLDNDLTLTAAAPMPTAGTALSSFWGPDASQHVHYVGTDGHVHELYIEPGAPWKHNDLTAASSGALPRAGSPLDAYMQLDKGQHINFVGANGHVYELYLATGKRWECNDLTSAAAATVTVAAGSPLVGYYGSDTSQHINFLGTDGHVHELYAEPGAGWKINDLTAVSKAALPRAGSPLSSYWQTDGSQHVHFVSADGHVHELYITSGKSWVDNDLTILGKAPVTAAANSGLDSYTGPDTSQHVDYVGTDGHVHELYANKGAGWANNDLTVASSAKSFQGPAAGTPLCGYMQQDEGQHVNYLGTDGHVYELYLATGHSWECNDLTVSGAASETALDIAVAGSAAPGARIVVYIAPNSEKGWVDVLSTAIHDTVNKPSVLSISWGGNEGSWVNAISSVIADAGPLGVTVLAASGDNGAENPVAVGYPASDPNVIGCGGTQIDSVAGASFSQSAWNGSGGGVSNSFGLPSWQNNAGVPKSVSPAGHVGRGVPDIAGYASPGYSLFLGGAASPLIWFGTSEVAPLYAGLVARLNAQLATRVGTLNPTLYGLSDPGVFDDVTSGNNIQSGTSEGYSAGTRWDAVTGLGSVDGNELAYALAGPVGPSGAIAVRMQVNADQLDAVVIDKTGALTVCWVDRAGAWSGPLKIRPAGCAPMGGHVALAHQVSDNQLNAVCVDATGTVAVNWVVGDGNWSGPLAISAAGYAPAGAAVALASQVSTNQLDAVLVDATGAVSVFWVDGAGKWAGPLKVSGPGFAPSGAPVALAHQVNGGQLDAFVVDAKGTLQVFWVDGAGKWSGPLAISKPGFAPAGAAVAAHYQSSLEQLDVVLVDNTGTLQVFWVIGGGTWSGPVAISQPNFAPPGAPVAMEHQVSWNQLDVAVVDHAGTVSVFYVPGGGKWAGPVAISKAGWTKPGSALALSWQISRNQLDCLVADVSGALSVFYVLGAGTWQGPVPIPAGLS